MPFCGAASHLPFTLKIHTRCEAYLAVTQVTQTALLWVPSSFSFILLRYLASMIPGLTTMPVFCCSKTLTKTVAIEAHVLGLFSRELPGKCAYWCWLADSKLLTFMRSCKGGTLYCLRYEAPASLNHTRSAVELWYLCIACVLGSLCSRTFVPSQRCKVP